MEVVHSTWAGRATLVDGRGKVRRHHAVCFAIPVVAKCLGQSLAVGRIDITQRAAGIQNRMHLLHSFFSQR